MTAVAPTNPSVPRARDLQTGRLASSSKIAITSINIANHLMRYGRSAVRFLRLATHPWSSIGTTGELTTGHIGFAGYDSNDVDSDAYNDGLDAFIIGKRLTTAGEVAFGTYLALTDEADDTAGSDTQGKTVYRYRRKIFYDHYIQNRSFAVYSASVIPWPNLGYVDADSRSGGTPQISVHEDDLIGHATDGCISSVLDEIKKAWQCHVRCLYSCYQEFSSATTSWSNLVDHLVGTASFTVDCRGRQLYTDDTTAYVECWLNAKPKSSGTFQVKFSGSKGSTTLQVSTSDYIDRKWLQIDCTADDNITISFRAQGGATGLFFGCGMIEYLTTTPE